MRQAPARRTSRYSLSVVRGRTSVGNYSPLARPREYSVKIGGQLATTRGLTVFEQVLLNYRVMLVVRAVSSTTSHHRHDGLSLNRTRITWCLSARKYRADVKLESGRGGCNEYPNDCSLPHTTAWPRGSFWRTMAWQDSTPPLVWL